ncbi:MAG: type II toxin-antitoxin system HicA family toxin [Oligoflexus sp.]|nr:type II toxin-antitoxin system HicA family toxin [Oligoflexus sp.]
MKRTELESKLKELGWEFDRHGGNHDVWKKWSSTEAVPRHKDINEQLAKAILKRACRVQ